MDYHFNKTTVSQLVHLAGSETIQTPIQHNTNLGEVEITLNRTTPPNEDEYKILISHVVSLQSRLNNQQGLDEVQNVTYDPDTKVLKFSCTNGEISMELDEIKIHARGTQPPPEN